MSQTLRFNPGGHIDCLYTEAIDLRVLGRLQVVRATDIRFNDTSQQWDVHAAVTGQVLFSHTSRTGMSALGTDQPAGRLRDTRPRDTRHKKRE